MLLLLSGVPIFKRRTIKKFGSCSPFSSFFDLRSYSSLHATLLTVQNFVSCCLYINIDRES